MVFGLGAAGPSWWLVSLFLVILGLRYLVRFHDPAVRARHIEYWTAKQ